MPEHYWSDASALYQIQHGEHGTPRTESASEYLASRLLEWDKTTSTVIGRRLLEIVMDLRAGQVTTKTGKRSHEQEARS